MAASSTALCSVEQVIRWFPRSAYLAITPKRAVLSDSVAPEVKMISSWRAPTSPATFSRASSTATEASCPNGWSMLEGLPNFSVM